MSKKREIFKFYIMNKSYRKKILNRNISLNITNDLGSVYKFGGYLKIRIDESRYFYGVLMIGLYRVSYISYKI